MSIRLTLAMAMALTKKLSAKKNQVGNFNQAYLIDLLLNVQQ